MLIDLFDEQYVSYTMFATPQYTLRVQPHFAIEWHMRHCYCSVPLVMSFTLFKRYHRTLYSLLMKTAAALHI
jgi:hypothetical protein